MTITKDGITCTGLNPRDHYTISAKVVPTPKTNISYTHLCQLVSSMVVFAFVLLLILMITAAWGRSSVQKIQFAVFFLTINSFVSIAIGGPRTLSIMTIMFSLPIAETINYHQLKNLQKST